MADKAPSLYRVVYDFKGEEQGELSVTQGDLVMTDGADRDGWMLVETTEGEAQVGFIPADYAEPVESPAAEPSTALTAAPEDRLAAARADAQASLALAAPVASTAPTDGDTAENFSHLFASHEEWFTQATMKRQETFAGLEHALGDLVRKMVECEERNASIVSRLSELDNLLLEERSKWDGGTAT